MADSSPAVDALLEGVEQTKEEITHNPLIEWLARIGYYTRGLVYALVGALAVQVAIGARVAAPDQTGVLRIIGVESYGKFILVLMAVGLAGYSLWGFIRAFLDPLKRGTSLKALAERAGYVVSGIVYGALIFPVARIVQGAGGGGETDTQDWTAWLIEQPLGPWLVGLVGLVSMGGGLGEWYMAYSARFKKDFKTWEMGERAVKWATRLGRVGHSARGVIFLLMGFFLVRAALSANAGEAQGLDGALMSLARASYGPWLLGVVALGLIAFGLYSLLCARWIRYWRAESKE